tara:strand:- start:613 stop:1938 length:1326 start_codon:yes stop_codon:yes gene_type:complete
MSLINQVLKDIDSRSAQVEPVEQAQSSHSFLKHGHHADGQRRVIYFTAVLSFFAAVLICMVVYFFWLREPLANPVNQLSSLAKKGISFKSSASSDQSEKPVAELNDLTVERQLNAVDISMNFSSLPFVKVDLDENHHHLSVTLFNAKGIDKAEHIEVPGLGVFVVKPLQQNENLILSIELPFYAKLVKISPVQDAKDNKIHLSLEHIDKLRTVSNDANGSINLEKKPMFSVGRDGNMSRLSSATHDTQNQHRSVHHINDTYRQVISMIKTGDVDQATVAIRQQIAAHGVDPKLVLMLMKLLIQQNRVKDAEFIGSSALASYPHNPELLALQAQIQFQQGRIQQALGILSSWTPPMGHYPTYYGLMASIYLKQGQPMLAGAIYRRLIELKSKNVQWWVGFGVSMQALAQNNLAAGAYKKALTIGFEDMRMRDFVVRQLAMIQ